MTGGSSETNEQVALGVLSLKDSSDVSESIISRLATHKVESISLMFHFASINYIFFKKEEKKREQLCVSTDLAPTNFGDEHIPLKVFSFG